MKYAMLFVAIMCLPGLWVGSPESQRTTFIGECIMWSALVVGEAIEEHATDKAVKNG